MKQFKHHKHIFFDLDNTLWDFSGNSRRILAEMYLEFNLSAKGITDFEAFHTQYKFRNEQLWNAYRLGEISREEVRLNRFLISLRAFEVYDHGVASDMAEQYLIHTKKQTELIPHTIETLEYLQTKYQLHIITNGFEEVQHFKLKNCGIEKYFKTVTTAEEARSLKPDIKIFQTA
ncbi:MAG: HAD hydrolase-like protein, partial [Chitinophagales bacterium]|nr:HAD hydrolase-like protein [Chitinophagales bacterium]